MRGTAPATFFQSDAKSTCLASQAWLQVFLCVLTDGWSPLPAGVFAAAVAEWGKLSDDEKKVYTANFKVQHLQSPHIKASHTCMASNFPCMHVSYWPSHCLRSQISWHCGELPL